MGESTDAECRLGVRLRRSPGVPATSEAGGRADLIRRKADIAAGLEGPPKRGFSFDQLAPVSRTQKDAPIELNVSNGNAADNLVRDCFEMLLRCCKTGIFADRIAAVI